MPPKRSIIISAPINLINKDEIKAQPVKEIRVVTSAIELQPRVSQGIKKKPLFNRIAQKIGWAKKLGKADIGAPLLQPLEIAFGPNVVHSEGLQRMIAGAKPVGAKFIETKPKKLSPIKEPQILSEDSSSDTDSVEEWPSDTPSSQKTPAYKTPQTKISRTQYDSAGYIKVDDVAKFSTVRAGPYLATTARYLNRAGVGAKSIDHAKTPPPAPSFSRAGPKVAPKPKFLPEIVGTKINLSPPSYLATKRGIGVSPNISSTSSLKQGPKDATTRE
jgi:hypothetical protein